MSATARMTFSISINTAIAAAATNSPILVEILRYGIGEVPSPKAVAGLPKAPTISQNNPVTNSGSHELVVTWPAGGTPPTGYRKWRRPQGQSSFDYYGTEVVILPEQVASDGSVTITETLTGTAGTIYDYLYVGIYSAGIVSDTSTSGRASNEGERCVLLGVVG